MVLVPLDHFTERFQLGLVRTHQARLLKHIHSQTVADIEQRR